MAIGSFVDGVFKGMDRREQRDDRVTNRERDTTRFERDGERWESEKEDMGRSGDRWTMEQERHAAAMRASARAGRPSTTQTRAQLIASIMAEGGDPASVDQGGGGSQPQGGGNGFSINMALPQSNNLSYGTPAATAQGLTPEQTGAPAPAPAPAAAPIELSALSATPQGQQPQRFTYQPGQGLIPRGTA